MAEQEQLLDTIVDPSGEPLVDDEPLADADSLAAAQPVEDDEPVIIIPEPAPEPPRKKRRFGKGLLIYTVLALVAITLALWFLYTYLARFEARTPNAALNQYMQWVREADYDAMLEASGFEETLLNDNNAYLAYLKRLYADPGTLTVREQVTTDTSVRRYSLYGGEKRLATLLLNRNPQGDGSTWYVTTELVYQEDYTITVAEDVRLTVNGMEASLLSLPYTEQQAALFPTAEAATTEHLPVVRQYTLSGLLNPPTVAALTLAGEDCTVVQNGNDLLVYSALPADKTAYEELAKTAATTYAKFVARDASRTDVLKLVHPDSQLNRTIKNFSNAWFTRHDSYEFQNMAVTDYTGYSDRDFSCIVSFEPKYIRNGKVLTSAPVRYQLTFLKTEDTWKLYSLTQTTLEGTATSPDSTAATTTTTAAATATTTATP